MKDLKIFSMEMSKIIRILSVCLCFMALFSCSQEDEQEIILGDNAEDSCKPVIDSMIVYTYTNQYVKGTRGNPVDIYIWIMAFFVIK